MNPRKIDVETLSDARYYGGVWYQLLRHLLGWPETLAVDYVVSMIPLLVGTWLIHDEPSAVAARRIALHVNGDRQLQFDLEITIMSVLPVSWSGPAATWSGTCDWRLMDKKCNELLKRYEVTISEIREKEAASLPSVVSH